MPHVDLSTHLWCYVIITLPFIEPQLSPYDKEMNLNTKNHNFHVIWGDASLKLKSYQSRNFGNLEIENCCLFYFN